MDLNATTPASSHPFYHVFQLGLKIQHFGQKLEIEAGISLAQWSILKQLVDHPASSALSLAHTVGIQPSTLTQALKRLEKKDFIYLEKDPSDSRKKILSLTRAGKLVLDRADSWLHERLQEFKLDPEEVQSLWERLLRIS